MSNSISDPKCSICREEFKEPVSLPCGHVFCETCLRKMTMHNEFRFSVSDIRLENGQREGGGPTCSTCGASYPIVAVDPALVPTYLRAHVLPAVRPLIFQDRAAADDLTINPARSLPTPTPTEIGSDIASPTASSSLPLPTFTPNSESTTTLTALHLACTTWRRRAETHALGNTRLLLIARKARDYALRMRAERDQARNECVLFRRLMDEMCGKKADSTEGQERGRGEPSEEPLLSPSPFAPLAPRLRDRSPSPGPLLRRQLPTFVLQSREYVCDDIELLGSPMKRRRVDDESRAVE